MKIVIMGLLIALSVGCATVYVPPQGYEGSDQQKKDAMKRDMIQLCHGTNQRNLTCTYVAK